MIDTASATPEQAAAALSMSNPKYKDGPEKLRRNQYGLVENIDYVYEDTGHVNWKAMINPKFLYPNKAWFERNNKPIPDSIDGLQDHQIICKLGGYKELARLRGFSNVEYKLEYLENGVSCICTITWIPNYETAVRSENKYSFADTVTFSSIANSTSENCGDSSSSFSMAIFKETQAENRSFVRCVRNFLNVNVVGEDEISKGEDSTAKANQAQTSGPDALNPRKNLESQALKRGYKTLADLKAFLKTKNYTPKEKTPTPWASYDDIPVSECWKISQLINE